MPSSSSARAWLRERNIGELELRVALGGDDCGVCRVILDERDDEIHVRVLVCCCDDDDDEPRRDREYMDWPCASGSSSRSASER
jgi:hypothetical protein